MFSISYQVQMTFSLYEILVSFILIERQINLRQTMKQKKIKKLNNCITTFLIKTPPSNDRGVLLTRLLIRRYRCGEDV